MSLLSFSEFLNEKENVRLDQDLREYVLTHLRDSSFEMRSKDFYRQFDVKPFTKEQLGALQRVHRDFQSSLTSVNPREMLSAIQASERIGYSFGGIYTAPYTLKNVPDLQTTLEDEQRRILMSSDTEFMLNVYSQLGKSMRDEIVENLRERCEVLCCVIEALFYYVRLTDKENFFQGMDRKEVCEEYSKAIEKASKEGSFSVEGPFSDTVAETPVDEKTSKAYWKCQKNLKDFRIEASLSPKDLREEENAGGVPGLKVSLIRKDETPEGEYFLFPVTDFVQTVKRFLKR